MTDRYLISSRRQGEEPEPIEEDGVKPIALLDRGFVADLDPTAVDRLVSRGLRLKPLVGVNEMRLFDYVIDTQEGRIPVLPVLPGTESEADIPTRNFLVQFVGPLQETWLSVLHQRGIDPIEPVGPFGYFVQADQNVVDELRGLTFVAWVGRLEPAYKVNPVLLEQPGASAGTVSMAQPGDPMPSINNEGTPGIVGVHVGVLADADLGAIIDIIEGNGGEVLDEGDIRGQFRNLLTRFPDTTIGALARRDDVRWLDPLYESTPEDERTAQILYEDLDGAAAPNTGPVVGYAANLTALGLDGTGTTIAICDTGVSTNNAATMHADLNGRFSFSVDGQNNPNTSADANGHGTHVAGIAAGNGASGDTDPQGFQLGLGLAPGANLGSIFANNTWANRIATAAQNGADVMNSSLGVNGAGASYSASDRDIDLGVRDASAAVAGIRPIVLTFSAGNSGPGAQTCTKATKNAIVVGNALNFRPGEGNPSDDIRGLRNDSSRGPTADGRTFPTLTAPGTDVVSARGGAYGSYTDTNGIVHNTHARASGTSMAAPAAAGICALLIEWWRATRSGATPSPALLKAMLAVSTEPVAGGDDGNGGTIAAGPTNDAGWGRISLENTLLQTPASNHGPKIFNDQRHAFTASGQEYRIRVAAADPALPLRVSLAWTDAAAMPGANPTLVNDLDLEVLEVDSGNIYVGNSFAGAFSTPGGVADSLNNLEIVAVQNPTGVYEVCVVASNITASARTDIAGLWQDFALVIDNGEVPAADPVSVVTVIDRSGSMEAFGYVDVTRQASRQFIDLMSVDDSVGVVSFGDNATLEFPPAPASTPAVIVGPATRVDARNAVDNIVFGGCTFMGDGIETAGNLLASAGNRSAIVLLSDGYDNKGCDQGNPSKPSAMDAAAALSSDLPIYSCAMGPSSDQNTLEQLALSTNGRYYYMPTIDDLFEIYNYIRGQVTGEGVIINESAMASRSSTQGYVDACAEAVTFSVTWHNPKLRYISGPATNERHISVRLRTPSGRWLPYNATEVSRTVGEGYVVFRIDAPQPGLWSVEVSTERREHTPYTVGGFVRSDLALDLSVPSRLVLGQIASFKTVVTDAGQPIDDVKVVGRAFAPNASLTDLSRRWLRDLDEILVPDALLSGSLSDDHRTALKMQFLRSERLAVGGDDIMAPVATSLQFTPQTVTDTNGRGTAELLSERRQVTTVPNIAEANPLVGRHSLGLTTVRAGSLGHVFDWRRAGHRTDRSKLLGTYGKLKVPGSYSVNVTASGFSTRCRTRFVRKDFASFVVSER
jgi:subtilisin family serine protease